MQPPRTGADRTAARCVCVDQESGTEIRDRPPSAPSALDQSVSAQRKAARKRTEPVDGEPLPVHSFHTLLGDLATLTRNVIRLGRDHLTTILATPTATQRRALDLLAV